MRDHEHPRKPRQPRSSAPQRRDERKPKPDFHQRKDAPPTHPARPAAPRAASGEPQPAKRQATPGPQHQGDGAPSKRSIRQKERFEGLKARRHQARSDSHEGHHPSRKPWKPLRDQDDELDERLDQLELGHAGQGEALVWDPEQVKAQAEMFANRLKKRRQHLWKWARRTGVSCFRIYDRDIPELPFQVDEYEKHLLISQIIRVRSVDEEHARLWTETMVDAAARALGVERAKVFLKNRVQQKGNAQYEKTAETGYIIQAHEAGLNFELNLSDYLDTGLFLDHRDTRIMVGGLALGARVLNLFSYTGSFSVHAARGGALSTTSVDLSNTYTQWAERNLALNGFVGKSHRCICDDVLSWVNGAVERREQYEIIVCDPPTFSNSKKMDGVFDVQRDHPWLINQLLRLLTRNGIIVFSNNFRKFKLDVDALRTNYVDDITFKSIPEDFKGKKPHKCYVIKRDN